MRKESIFLSQQFMKVLKITKAGLHTEFYMWDLTEFGIVCVYGPPVKNLTIWGPEL